MLEIIIGEFNYIYILEHLLFYSNIITLQFEFYYCIYLLFFKTWKEHFRIVQSEEFRTLRLWKYFFPRTKTMNNIQLKISRRVYLCRSENRGNQNVKASLVRDKLKTGCELLLKYFPSITNNNKKRWRNDARLKLHLISYA